MQDYEREIFKSAILTKGIHHQSNIAMEECAELIQAISKQLRYNTNQTREHLCEEIADVSICLDQLMMINDLSREEVDAMRLKKVARIQKRLDNREL